MKGRLAGPWADLAELRSDWQRNEAWPMAGHRLRGACSESEAPHADAAR